MEIRNGRNSINQPRAMTKVDFCSSERYNPDHIFVVVSNVPGASNGLTMKRGIRGGKGTDFSINIEYPMAT